jgi:hypothetical protein
MRSRLGHGFHQLDSQDDKFTESTNGSRGRPRKGVYPGLANQGVAGPSTSGENNNTMLASTWALACAAAVILVTTRRPIFWVSGVLTAVVGDTLHLHVGDA